MEGYGFTIGPGHGRLAIRAAFSVLRRRLNEVGKPIKRVTREQYAHELGSGRSEMRTRVTAEVFA